MSRFASMAGEAVADLAERTAEPGRLSRGRSLFRKGSVSDLTIGDGSVFASVRGSEGDPYETAIATASAPPGVIREMVDAYDQTNPMSVDDMIAEGVQVAPGPIDLAFSCDCADWEEPCKHAIAVLLALADRVDIDEVELLRWRGIDLAASTGEGDENSASPAPAGQPGSGWTPPQAEPDDRSAKLSELEALLGDTVVRVPPTDGTAPEPAASPLDPAMADFLGVGTTLEPIDVGTIVTPAQLFADVQLGPLADLGPVLANALAIIADRLDDR